jgi:hypothetical protein
MEILRAETDRYVLGVRLQKEDMESLYKKISEALGHPPVDNTCYCVEERPTGHFWIEFSDQFVTIGDKAVR